MTDREKVIKGLEEAFEVIAAHVPERYWGYSLNACKDAQTILKAQDEKCRACGEKTNNAIQALQAELKSQESRVIALEEMHRGMVAWLEDIDKPDVILAIGGSSCGGAKCFILENDVAISAKDDEYNIRWRAWTQEPTIEQRKAVKWK